MAFFGSSSGNMGGGIPQAARRMAPNPGAPGQVRDTMSKYPPNPATQGLAGRPQPGAPAMSTGQDQVNPAPNQWGMTGSDNPWGSVNPSVLNNLGAQLGLAGGLGSGGIGYMPNRAPGTTPGFTPGGLGGGIPITALGGGGAGGMPSGGNVTMPAPNSGGVGPGLQAPPRKPGGPARGGMPGVAR